MHDHPGQGEGGTTLGGSEPRFEKFLVIICDQWSGRHHATDPDQPTVDLPGFDRLCRTGVRFEQACTAASACTPSRAALLTSRWFGETGVWATSGLHLEAFGRSFVTGLDAGAPACTLPTPDRLPNLGSVLSDAGFATVYKGKWHLSDAEGPWPAGDAVGLDGYGFSGWVPPEGHGVRRARHGLVVDEQQTSEAEEALRSLARSGTERWVVVASLVNPHDIGLHPVWTRPIDDLGVPLPASLHDPLIGKPPCQRGFRRVWADTSMAARQVGDVLVRHRWPRTRTELWYEYVQLYAALTRHVDARVGRLLDVLDETGLRDDTCVVFVTDHGELGGGHGMMQKWYQAYEEAIRVPLVFSNPRVWPDGATTGALASAVDLLPTILGLAGADPPPDAPPLRGRDLSPVLTGQAAAVQEAVLFATDDDIFRTTHPWLAGRVPQPRCLRAVRTDRWKLVRYHDPSGRADPLVELYDLHEDPDELTDLGRDRGAAGVRRELEGLLAEELTERFDHPLL